MRHLRHAWELNPLVQASLDYHHALEMGEAGDVALTAQERERAHTGLGWLNYLCGQYAEALTHFQQAIADHSTSEAWLGQGYALYAMDKPDLGADGLGNGCRAGPP